jgi:hypothetical protein
MTTEKALEAAIDGLRRVATKCRAAEKGVFFEQDAAPMMASAIDVVLAALAQQPRPEQEAVAWQWRLHADNTVTEWRHGRHPFNTAEVASFVTEGARLEERALYTTPAPAPVPSAEMAWREIDLSKAIKHEHPDISTERMYLVKVHGGWFFGPFTRQWFGLSFSRWGGAGLQFDAPGWNSSRWERVIEIDPEALASPAPAKAAPASETERHDG